MSDNIIKTAVILAAGVGNRLKPLTNEIPKCMVEVSGKPLMEYILDGLQESGFERVIIVTGYRSDQIDNFLFNYPTSLNITTTYNDVFDKTNNIYSLWLASDQLTDGFVLIESDIILDSEVLNQFKYPDRIALDLFCKFKHNGTTATVDELNNLEDLYIKTSPPDDQCIYKTVNIYSFSNTTWQLLTDEIESNIQRGNVNCFYEKAIQKLIKSRSLKLKMVNFSDVWWDEIDTPDDLLRVQDAIHKRNELVLSD